VPANKIIATTREPAKLAALAAKGVTIGAANFDAKAHLTKAFAGATHLLLTSISAMEPGQAPEAAFEGCACR
jgi:NAD(P)H dehydrogenase (quinone)